MKTITAKRVDGTTIFAIPKMKSVEYLPFSEERGGHFHAPILLILITLCYRFVR